MEPETEAIMSGNITDNEANVNMHKAGGNVAKPVKSSVIPLPESSKTRWSWSLKPAPIPEEQIAETLSCEILVIGFGSGGAPAALYAASHGADTIVMTKNGVVEANGGRVGLWNSKHDAKYGITYDPLHWRKLIAHHTNGRGDARVFGSLVDRSGEAIDWMLDYMENLGNQYHLIVSGTEKKHLIAEFPDPNGQGDVRGLYTGFVKYMKAMAKQVEALGARVLYKTPAEQLLTDGSGRIVGAVGKRKEDGRYVRVVASQGVLMATGDITCDQEMLECFCPQMATCTPRNPYGSTTGDGHKMAMWVGAAMDTPPFTVGQSYPHDFSGKIWPAGFVTTPWLRVNINGERYCNESIGYHDHYANVYLNTADSMQPKHLIWQICDSDFSRAFYGNLGAYMTFNYCVELGSIKRADSITELADIIGVPADKLEATVRRYNAFCKSGKDMDYGVDAEILENTSIEKGPFYALPRMVVNSATEGGMKVNERFQVVNENRRPLGGLWAAGTCMGGMYGFSYLWEDMSASNKMSAMAGGINAVRDMLGELS